MVQDGVLAATVANANFDISVNPLIAAKQLSSLLANLQHAAETAKLCGGICKDIVATACGHVPILCKLLAVGNVYADTEEELNTALSGTLNLCVHALRDAVDLKYEYISCSWMGKMKAAASTEAKMEEKRTCLFYRFNDIPAHLQVAKYLQLKEGVAAVVPVVGEVEAIRGDLVALQHLHNADRAHVKAAAAASGERKREEGQRVAVCHHHAGYVFGVAVSPDGQWFATCGGDAHVAVWDAATGAHVRDMKGHTSNVWCVAWSPDGSRLATASDDRTTRVWEVATGAVRRVLESHAGGVKSVAWSSDGKKLCTGSVDRNAKVWEVATGAVVHVLDGHTGTVCSVAWRPDGRLVATGSDDSSVMLWDSAKGAAVRVLQGHTHTDIIYGVTGVAWSPDGSMLASCSRDNIARVWDAATGTVKRTMQGHSDILTCVAWRPDGRTLATASHDRHVRLWDVATGNGTRVIYTFSYSRVWTSVAWSPCGRLVFFAGDGVRIYRVSGDQ